jgi:hypothetical protein
MQPTSLSKAQKIPNGDVGLPAPPGVAAAAALVMVGAFDLAGTLPSPGLRQASVR